MLSVALIYSVTSNFDKIGVQNSSTTFLESFDNQYDDCWICIVVSSFTSSDDTPSANTFPRHPHGHWTLSSYGAVFSQYWAQFRSGPVRHRH